ncbi:hypothetical protein [Okeania sp. SIO2C9]|nr:hypothetical protein [Okeania sp. SIO2C9]
MNIRLIHEQEKFIEAQVNSGKFATFEEAYEVRSQKLEVFMKLC